MMMIFVIEQFLGLCLFEDSNTDRAGLSGTQGFFHGTPVHLPESFQSTIEIFFIVQKIGLELKKCCFFDGQTISRDLSVR